MPTPRTSASDGHGVFGDDWSASARRRSRAADIRLGRRQTEGLTDEAYPAHSMRRMARIRLTGIELSEFFSPRSILVPVATEPLIQDVPLQDLEHLAGPSTPKTAPICDGTQRRATRNIIERISI